VNAASYFKHACTRVRYHATTADIWCTASVRKQRVVSGLPWDLKRDYSAI